VQWKQVVENFSSRDWSCEFGEHRKVRAFVPPLGRLIFICRQNIHEALQAADEPALRPAGDAAEAAEITVAAFAPK
jgi:hypothetical protein